MVITYKSTGTERIQISILDSDGSKRVGTLERDPNNNRIWKGSVDHPSGETFPLEFHDPNPDPSIALGGLAQAVTSRENDYRQSKSRGHRPAPQPVDRNLRLHEESPIIRTNYLRFRS